MKTIEAKIDPTSEQDTSESKISNIENITLSLKEINKKFGEEFCLFRYKIGKNCLDYGVNRISVVYIDIAKEIENLCSGISHFITIAEYPICFIEIEGDVFYIFSSEEEKSFRKKIRL